MVSLGQTNGLAFFLRPPEAMDLYVLLGVNVSMFVSGGFHIYINCICV